MSFMGRVMCWIQAMRYSLSVMPGYAAQPGKKGSHISIAAHTALLLEKRAVSHFYSLLDRCGRERELPNRFHIRIIPDFIVFGDEGRAQAECGGDDYSIGGVIMK